VHPLVLVSYDEASTKMDIKDQRKRQAVESLQRRKRENPRPRFSLPEVCVLLNERPSTVRRRARRPDTKLVAYRTEGKVFFDADSVYDEMIADIINAPDKIMKAPTGAFVTAKKKQPRSPAQLAALRAHRDELAQLAEEKRARVAEAEAATS
jgi:hypothetical protein